MKKALLIFGIIVISYGALVGIANIAGLCPSYVNKMPGVGNSFSLLKNTALSIICPFSGTAQ